MAENGMQLEDWLDDLCVRFIINLPQEDLSSVARICFQVEEAQWFYEDFIRPLDPTLPSMSLRVFCLRIFQHCPLLASFSVENHTLAFQEFLQYKTRVPVRGAIMLNHSMDSVVLVKGWKKGASWSFPRGKINKDEDDVDCAIREVWEETGLDLRASGLVPLDKKPKYIEISMREQQLRLYVFRDIPMDTDFQPRTRKEISKIQWYKLSELPAFRKKGENVPGDNFGKFYMVAPFLVPLKKWIASQKRMEGKRATGITQANTTPQHPTHNETTHIEDEPRVLKQTGPITPNAAIDTLDGSTQELQWLLKTKSSGCSISQTSHHEDKGSALLSILQSGGRRCLERCSTPQTPSDSTASQPSRHPHHTHHYTASRNIQVTRIPPSFCLVSNQMITPRKHPEKHEFIFQKHPLAVGRSRLSPDSELTINFCQPHSLPSQISNDAPDRSATDRSEIRPSTSPSQPGQFEGCGHLHGVTSSQKPRPAQLDEHSMALLDVLKGNEIRAVPAQVPECELGQATVNGQNMQIPLRHSSAVLPQRPPYLGHTLTNDVAPLQSSRDSIESDFRKFKDHHRSALLEIFKKSKMDTFDKDAHAAGPSKTSAMPSGTPERRQWEKKLPRNRPPGQAQGDMDSLKLAQSRQISQRRPNVCEDTLRFHPRSWAHNLPTRASHEQLVGAPHPETMAWPGEGRDRPGVPDEQKRHLLSLFRKQQAPSKRSIHGGSEAANAIPVAASDVMLRTDSVSATSSRRGTETPISPADQSFLLEYLRAVTKDASP